MGRLIDIDALLEQMKELYEKRAEEAYMTGNRVACVTWDDAVVLIKNAPIIDDAISRQAAIDAIRASTSKYTGFMEMEMYTDDDAVEAIEALPSAEPRKKGKWIAQNPNVDTEECSECGYNILSTELETPYCPWCGAIMPGGEEDDCK